MAKRKEKMEFMRSIAETGDEQHKNFVTAHHSEPTYDDYLHTLLSDYGIQFSPGGSGIVEIDEEPCSPQFEEDQQVSERRKTKDQQVAEGNETGLQNLKTEGRKSDSSSCESGDFKRAARVNAESDEDVALTIDVDEHKKAVKSAPRKKCKLYELEPLEDPEHERKRMNAVLAKKNRELKKTKMRNLDETVRRLRHVNAQCTKVIRRTHSDIQELRQELDAEKYVKNQLTEMVKSKSREIRRQRENLLLFQGHLDLIGSSLDDDNPANRLIQNLLSRLSSCTSADVT